MGWLYAGAGAALTLFAPALHAETKPWQPGERTTSSLGTEVEGGDARETDGVYGRFDGELTWSLALGADYVPRAPAFHGLVFASVRYFTIAGAYGTFREPFDDSGTRRISCGVDFRPLFLYRWSEDLESGPARLDLFVDSLSFTLGALWSTTPGGDRTLHGAEAGLGLGFPLLAQAAGPWIVGRGNLEAYAGNTDQASIWLGLEWEFLTPAPFSSGGD
jgi:hypothetical protein